MKAFSLKCFSAIILVGGGSVAFGDVIPPYFMDFDSAPVGSTPPPEWTNYLTNSAITTSSMQVTANGSNHEYQAHTHVELTTGPSVGDQSTTISPNRSEVKCPTLVGQDFLVRTEMRLDSFSEVTNNGSSTQAYAGINVLANSSNGVGTTLFYIVNSNSSDQIFGGSVGKLMLTHGNPNGYVVDGISPFTIAPVFGQKYVIELEGHYGGGGLNLTGRLYLGSSLITLSGSQTDPFTTPNFGTYISNSASGVTPGSGPITVSSDFAVTYDNFSIQSVPEPTSVASIGVALAFLIRRRRK